MRLLFSLTTFFVVVVVILSEQQVEATCGYAGCPTGEEKMINVHLVPHTHDDVGWLKTVDQYYFGARNDIQNAGVQYIIESVVGALLIDPKRRFIYVESAFFFKWFDEQTPELKSQVKRLVQEGRLEFAGGAWAMNDEAAAHYTSIIDQFTIGLKKLHDNFGICGRPHVGWQIDPFGHSREMASLFAQMGYDGEFFGRIDWIDKNERLKNKTAEMIWKASESLDENVDLFAGLLYNQYQSPPGFCFDTLCSDGPIIDGDSYDNNVQEKVDAFIAYIKSVNLTYRGNHVLITMGGDFTYQNAVMNFRNMDKLIKYVNERQSNGSKVNVFYSTPACYLKALHTESLTWPTKIDDFFPYSSDAHSYWTGYFSSRPTQKRFERFGNNFLQVTKQLVTFANLTGSDVDNNLDKLRQAMGVMQHHDAITGTEKQHVANDYYRLLSAAIESAHNDTRLALQKLTNLTSGEFVSCLQLNISVCDFMHNHPNGVIVTLFNPLALPSGEYVRVPVKNEKYEVIDSTGRVIPSDLLPIPKEVQSLSFRKNDATHEVVFWAHIEKLDSYLIKRKNNQEKAKETVDKSQNLENEENYKKRNTYSTAERVVGNSHIKLTFTKDGHLSKIGMNGITENIRQDFFYYQGASGYNFMAEERASGAYIFRPNGTALPIGKIVKLNIYEGAKVKEIHQHFNEWVSQVIRIYEGVNSVEFEWLIGPIPVQDSIGKEIITRFTSNLNSNRIFYTDANGREMLRRVRNKRDYFKPDLHEAISANYYPVTARIAIEDAEKRLTLLNDRAQGGSSLKDGQLELMLHRRLLQDDNFGVGEALDERAFGHGLVARGKVYLILSNVDDKPSRHERFVQQQIHMPFWKFFSSPTKVTNNKVYKLPAFKLPSSVHLLTLEPFGINERLIRFENIMDKSETSPVTFNLREIFDQLGGEGIRETTLDGSLSLSEMSRLKFQPDGSNVTKLEYIKTKHTPLSATSQDTKDKFDIKLGPMQIRTFILKWKK